MKAIYKIISSCLIIAGFAATFISCSSDIDEPVLLGFDNMPPRSLVASKDVVVLDGLNETADAVSLRWGNYDLTTSNPDYNVPQDKITHHLEFSKTADFTDVTSIQVSGNEKTFTNEELNLVLSKYGFEKRVAAPVYTRIRYVLGENKAPGYSETLMLTVTPYGILFNRMDVMATDKEKVIGHLWSPTENGIYEGYVGATGDWMNFYLRDNEGNIWGCVPDNAYNMTNDEDNMWNFWLQNQAGCWRVTADTNTRTWQSAQLLSMKLISSNGKSRDMKFDRKTNTYSCVVTTTGTETFSVEAKTKRYSINHKDGIDGENIKYEGVLTISEAGNWIVTLDMNGTAQHPDPTASYALSEDEEQVSYPDALLMIDNNNWDNVKARFYSPNHDGTYWGFYRTTTGWENFLLSTEDKTTIWGSLAGSQFTLDSSDSRWNLWGDEKTCLKRYWVSLVDEQWSETNIDKISVAGSIDEGNKELTYDATSKTWQAVITVSDPNGWGVKILLNDDWSDVFVKKDNGRLGYNDGGDINLPGTGKYRLTININDFENMTYTFTKID